MKSLNKTETPNFVPVVCSVFSKGNLFDVYFIVSLIDFADINSEIL